MLMHLSAIDVQTLQELDNHTEGSKWIWKQPMDISRLSRSTTAKVHDLHPLLGKTSNALDMSKCLMQCDCLEVF
jgi:hypothetical protein